MSDPKQMRPNCVKWKKKASTHLEYVGEKKCGAELFIDLVEMPFSV
jgi:hypothetical protein